MAFLSAYLTIIGLLVAIGVLLVVMIKFVQFVNYLDVKFQEMNERKELEQGHLSPAE